MTILDNTNTNVNICKVGDLAAKRGENLGGGDDASPLSAFDQHVLTAMNPNVNPPNQDAHRFYQPHVAHNMKQLQFIRSCFAAIAGSAAGILGLTNWSGFLFYALSWTILATMLILIKSHSQPSKYFMNGWRELVVDGALGGLLSYILFHTFLYGLVHLYQ